MKRFIFWCLVTVAVVSWLRVHDAHRNRHRDSDAQAYSRAKVVVRKLPAPGHEGATAKGQTVYVIESDDKKIVTIDDGGVHVASADEGDRRVEGRPNASDFDGDGEWGRDTTRRESADGLPVSVVPGTRTTEARIETPVPPPHQPPPPPAKKGSRRRPKPPAPIVEEKVEPKVVAGRLSATEDRARADARLQLANKLPGWLDPDVPRDWPVPNRFVDRMIRDVTIVPVERDYGTMYQATMLVDASPRSRREIVHAYRHEQVLKRLVVLGGGLAFALISLATLSGYIRADEATKGYYTNRLRLVSTVGLGAAGVAIYRMLA